MSLEGKHGKDPFPMHTLQKEHPENFKVGNLSSVTLFALVALVEG